MLKKIMAVLLAAILCFAMASCSADETPDGMYSVTLDGEPFILYVPNEWTSNSASGISSAYYSATSRIAVSARYCTYSASALTIDEYASLCIEEYSEDSGDFELKSRNASVLGGSDAVELIYSTGYDDESFTFIQRIAKHSGGFVHLTFYTPSELFEENRGYFNEIADAFVLCEMNDEVNDCVTDKKTPDGMKIASSDKLEYRLYVPQAWICNSQGERSEAYYPESGKPNVTVTSYSPDKSMTAEEYFEECEEMYKKTFDSYTLISSEDKTVAGREAKAYTYSVSASGAELRIMQTVFVYSDMVYSITYTALADSFDVHMDDVSAMLDAFTFR